jgi:hypothetical protein
MDQVTCCCFDLESSSLNADFGIVLCGVVKAAGKKPKIFRLDAYHPDWDRERGNDRHERWF